MKQLKSLLLIVFIVLGVISCQEDEEIEIYNVSVQLVYPDSYEPIDSITVTVGAYSAYTDTAGIAIFSVPSGTYDIAASESRSVNGLACNFNGSTSLTIAEDVAVNLELTISEASQIIIKEVYIGGCQMDDGSGAFSRDAYIILYNNSDFDAIIDSTFCIACAFPYNSNSTNYYLDANGNLTYADEGWIPAAAAFWYFQGSRTLAPGEQILIAIYQAIDQTGTYSNSVDLSNSEYYCMYDIEDFSQENYYTAPSSNIPTSQYLKAIKYGLGSAWVLSKSSPALFVFSTQDMGPLEFGTDADYTDYYGGSSTQLAQKVPIEWIIDAIDIFRKGYDDSNNRRFTDDIDAGSITFTNTYGYTLYRNVDQEATEAITNNDGLIVYDYAYGTNDLADGSGSTDPTGIDAEASIANGARIVYKDTNNSSNDFHQRSSASIK